MRIRRALQRWIEDYPKIVGTDLIVITTEFNDWELGCDCSSLGRKGELVLFTEALYAFVIDGRTGHRALALCSSRNCHSGVSSSKRPPSQAR